MAKDNNKYQVYIEYDARNEKASFMTAKNNRNVPFKELPPNEQDIIKAMVFNALANIAPELTEVPEQPEQESETKETKEE